MEPIRSAGSFLVGFFLEHDLLQTQKEAPFCKQSNWEFIGNLLVISVIHSNIIKRSLWTILKTSYLCYYFKKMVDIIY
jgi:hypothetical protein